jgi:hypothetical protein
MKLDLGPEPFTKCVLAAPLLLAWVVAGVVGVAAAVMLPPVSLQLPGNLLLSLLGVVCCAACVCCTANSLGQFQMLRHLSGGASKQKVDISHVIVMLLLTWTP